MISTTSSVNRNSGKIEISELARMDGGVGEDSVKDSMKRLSAAKQRTHNTHQEIHTPAHSRVHGTCKCIFFYVCIVCAVNKKCTCAHTIHTKKYIRPRTLGYTVRVSAQWLGTHDSTSTSSSSFGSNRESMISTTSSVNRNSGKIEISELARMDGGVGEDSVKDSMKRLSAAKQRTHNTHQEIHTPAHSRVHGTCKCIIFYVCIVCAVNKKCTCAHTIHTKKYIRPRTLGYTVRVSAQWLGTHDSTSTSSSSFGSNRESMISTTSSVNRNSGKIEISELARMDGGVGEDSVKDSMKRLSAAKQRTHNTHQEIHTPAHSRVHGTCKCIIFYVCIVCVQ